MNTFRIITGIIILFSLFFFAEKGARVILGE